MKRLCKILTACAALTLTSTTIKAQSCDAAYPLGWWINQLPDDEDETNGSPFYVEIHINRVTELDSDIGVVCCGTLSVAGENDKDNIGGPLLYAGKGLNSDGTSNGVYYFDIIGEGTKKERIGLRQRDDKLEFVSYTGPQANSPFMKEKMFMGPASGSWLPVGYGWDDEKGLLECLRDALTDYDKDRTAERTRGFGNVKQYIAAHANLNPALPKYAKPKGAGAINIRAKASTTAEKVAELKPGETLLVIDEYDGWCQVKLGEDKTGWVSLSVVTLTNTKGRTPAATTSFVLGNGKLGPLFIGQAVSALPKSVPGLYDRYVVKKESFADEDGEWEETFCHFYKGGKLIFKAGVSDSKQIASFTLEKGSEFIKTTEGFHVGYSARDLFTRKPMEWETWYQGTTFARSGQWEYRILSDDLINADIPTKPSDIKATGKILTITHFKDSPQE